MIQTVILENHTFFRLGVKNVFEDNPDICITGEATNGEDFIKLLDCTQADVALMAVNTPEDYWCVDVVCFLRKKHPDLKILVIANEDTAQVVQSMMEAGINGYIGKRQTNREELEKAIRTVAAGGEYIGRIDTSFFSKERSKRI